MDFSLFLIRFSGIFRILAQIDFHLLTFMGRPKYGNTVPANFNLCNRVTKFRRHSWINLDQLFSYERAERIVSATKVVRHLASVAFTPRPIANPLLAETHGIPFSYLWHNQQKFVPNTKCAHLRFITEPLRKHIPVWKKHYFSQEVFPKTHTLWRFYKYACIHFELCSFSMSELTKHVWTKATQESGL